MKIDKKNTMCERLRILGDDEIEALYGRPHFPQEERAQYFSLSQIEKNILAEFRSTRSQIYFILQLGYFKAQHFFFTFDLHEVKEDVEHILSDTSPMP